MATPPATDVAPVPILTVLTPTVDAPVAMLTVLEPAPEVKPVPILTISETAELPPAIVVVLAAAGQKEKASEYLGRAAEANLLPEEKALLDGVTAIALASSLGWGVGLSSLTILLFLKKDSSEIRHAAENAGNTPQRLLPPNFEEPSRRIEPDKMYLPL